MDTACLPGCFKGLTAARSCLPPSLPPPTVWSIRSLLALGTKHEPLGAGGDPFYTPAALAALCIAYLPLMALSAALAVPGGLFMPALLLGPRRQGGSAQAAHRRTLLSRRLPDAAAACSSLPRQAAPLARSAGWASARAGGTCSRGCTPWWLRQRCWAASSAAQSASWC